MLTKYQVTQTFEDIYVYTVEADSEEDAIREALAERGERVRMPRRVTMTVEDCE